MEDLLENLSFYLGDLPRYVSKLRKKCLQLPQEEDQKQLAFLVSFEEKMTDGLKLLLEKKDYHALLAEIRNPSLQLLANNKERYLAAITQDKGEFDQKRKGELMGRLAQFSLLHATKNKGEIVKRGIFTAAELWKRDIKTCANAMDIALGLHFYYTFFSHGYILDNFSEDFVSISPDHLTNAIISSVDIYKIVLVKNNLSTDGIIPTEKWLIALDDYKNQLFAGKDFFEIKATYILAYFDGDIDQYNAFARKHFYTNNILSAPPGEYPFLGEVKVPDNIPVDQIII